MAVESMAREIMELGSEFLFFTKIVCELVYFWHIGMVPLSFKLSRKGHIFR